MGIENRQANGQRSSGVEKDCIGSQGPQQTVVLEKRKNDCFVLLSLTADCYVYMRPEVLMMTSFEMRRGALWQKSAYNL
jgi:hypothetical protein